MGGAGRHNPAAGRMSTPRPGRRRRSRLVAPRRRLASSRAALRRPRSAWSASAASAPRAPAPRRRRSRSVTSSRFRSWLRDAARHESEPSRCRPAGWPSRASRRWRCSSVSVGERATSHQTSTRVDEVLTCCPPGPPEREARNSSSESGRSRSGRDLERPLVGHAANVTASRALHTCPRDALRFSPWPTSNSCGGTCSVSAGSLLGYSGGVDSALLAVVGPPGARPGALSRRDRTQRLLSRGAVAHRASSWPRGSTCRCSRSTPRELERPAVPRATHRTAATSASRSCGPASARSPSARGFDTIVDGTNADDLGEHRPGLRAAEEHRVRSPLAELGWSKAAMREASRALGLADLGRAGRALPLEPGASTGSRSRPSGSGRWRTARRYLRGLGVTGDLRVRHHGRPCADRGGSGRAARALRERVGRGGARSSAASASTAVELDPAGYRRGGLLRWRRARPR